jgi:hypothetical protein
MAAVQPEPWLWALITNNNNNNMFILTTVINYIVAKNRYPVSVFVVLRAIVASALPLHKHRNIQTYNLASSEF